MAVALHVSHQKLIGFSSVGYVYVGDCSHDKRAPTHSLGAIWRSPVTASPPTMGKSLWKPNESSSVWMYASRRSVPADADSSIFVGRSKPRPLPRPSTTRSRVQRSRSTIPPSATEQRRL